MHRSRYRNVKTRTAKPPWLTRRLPSGADYEKVRDLMHRGRLHTVCQEAKCPNIWECFSNRTATFLILGDRCTRHCRFCAVAGHPVDKPDPQEPDRVADAVKDLGLSYVVVTSVTRDDLPDGGAEQFARTVREIRRTAPEALIELLVPDFQGSQEALRTVLHAGPDVLNHNIETVPRLYPTVRPGADYRRSLQLLARVKTISASTPTKSGMMLGLGEADPEIAQTLADLLAVDCRMLTLGQYLQPTKNHLPVARYLPPEEFDQWKKAAFDLGFSDVASGPFVRSSYHAKDLFHASGHH